MPPPYVLLPHMRGAAARPGEGGQAAPYEDAHSQTRHIWGKPVPRLTPWGSHFPPSLGRSWHEIWVDKMASVWYTPRLSPGLRDHPPSNPFVGQTLPMTILPVKPPTSPTHLHPSDSVAFVSSDKLAVGKLIRMILERAAIPQTEIAKRMGIVPQSLNQYVLGRRANPSILWLARLAEMCGARIVIEWPGR